MKFSRLTSLMTSRLLWPVMSVIPSLITMRGLVSTSSVYAFRDMAQEFWPMTLWFQRAVSSGEFPLWDPFIACGQSAYVDPVRGLVFPPVLVLRLLLPAVLALNLSVGLAFPTAAVGMYLFLNRTLSRQSSALGAALFSVVGPVISTGNMLNYAWSVALLPWVVWAVLRFVEVRTPRALFVAALLGALQVISGEPVTLSITAGLAVVIAAADGVQSLGDRAGSVLRSALAIATGFGLAAFQLVPLYRAVALSDRSSRSPNFSFWSVHPLRLVETLSSGLFGDPFRSTFNQPWLTTLNSGREPFLVSLYVGIGLLLLAVVGVAGAPRRRAVLWTIVAIAGLLCSLGDHTPVYPFLASIIPPIRIFRYPEKYFVLVVFALIALAAEGFESLYVRDKRPIVLMTAASVGLVGLLVAVGLSTQSFARLNGVSVAAALDLRQSLMYSSAYAMVVGACFAGAVLLLKRPRLRPWLLTFVSVVAIGDLVTFGFNLNPQVPSTYLSKPLWAASLAQSASGARFYVGGRASCSPIDGKQDPDIIVPTGAFARNIPVSVLPALVAARTAQFPGAWGVREAVSVDNQVLFAREYADTLRTFCSRDAIGRSRFLERVGVRVQLLTHPPLGLFESATSVDDVPGVIAFKSSAPISRCAVVPGYRVEPDAREAANSLFREEFDPSSMVVGSPGTELEFAL